MRKNVSDAQVAMYLEECDPTLEAAIISAVEASAQTNKDHSPRLGIKCKSPPYLNVARRKGMRF